MPAHLLEAGTLRLSLAGLLRRSLAAHGNRRFYQSTVAGRIRPLALV